LIRVASDARATLDVVERISLAGRGEVTTAAFLEDVCRTVAEAFDFDSVAALRYDLAAEEVNTLAFAGVPPVARADRRLVSVPLLRDALERRDLVLLRPGGVTSAFALPLITETRCLGFVSATREGTVARTDIDRHGLATVGSVVATLLENALVREEMQRRDELKSEFLALAVHELRNPVASIYGISVTLTERQDALGESQQLALRDALREQAHRTRNLIGQLLDLARLDLAAIPISPARLRVRPKIEELVRSLADGRPDAVTVAVPPTLEACLDTVALDRMLSNLIANALRHGEPPVIVTAAANDRHLRLAVEDRGEGVPEEFVARLFQRFARSPAARARTDGSGLGLTIAQAYARAHGGEIVYERAMPRGARFEVVIPLRRYRDERPGAAESGCADVDWILADRL
jgi:two-component system sensor histidine kinase MtrB